MNNPRNYKAIVSKRQALSKKAFLFTLCLEEPKEIDFTAGQFIDVDVGENVRRAYSIASSPLRKHELELLVDIAPGGPGSKFFEKLQEKDAVTFIGPMGKFRLEENSGTIVFLSAGTGLAPFKSMIEDALEKRKTQDDQNSQMYLFQSFRYIGDIFLQNYFKSLAGMHDDFHFTLTLSRPEKGWGGKCGYVQDHVPDEIYSSPNTSFYVCGGSKMVKGVVKCLRDKGVDEKRIHFEPF